MGLAFLITTENLQLLSERKVLKEAEYAALLDAAAVIGAARGEAQRVAQKAAREADDLRRKGYEDGVQQARSEYAERMLGAAIDGHRQLHALREAMAQLVTKALTQFVADLDPGELFEAALRRVDTLLRSEPFVHVRVAPEQEATLRDVLDRLRDEAHWTMNIAVQVDPTLDEGACVLQTASGTLDIGLEAQLQAFRRAFDPAAMSHAAGVA
jgi:type III secretion protein L